MSSIPFEKLLEKYIIGAIDFATYRSERSDLIQQITQNEYKADITVPKSINTQQLNQTSAKNNSQNTEFIVPTIKQETSLSESARIQYSIIIILLIIGGISWYFTDRETKLVEEIKKPQPTQKITETTKTMKPSKKTDEPFIIAFNKKPHWDTESISDFLVQWQSLSPDQQDIARQSISFSNLSDSLRMRIVEQKNLKNNNAISTTRKESLLIWFASQLSISVN